MFVIDSILLSPVKGFMWLVRELHNAAQQEIEGETQRLTHRLSTLYMMLETEQITPEQFETQEREILERLAQLEAQDQAGDDEEEEEDQEQDDQEDQPDQPLSGEDRPPSPGEPAHDTSPREA